MESNLKSSREELLIELEIAELFYDVLGREPDPKGLDFYKNKILNKEETIEWVKTALLNSPEAKSRKKPRS